MLSTILLMIPFWLLLDLYFFQVFRNALQDLPPLLRRTLYSIYWLLDISLIGYLLYLRISDQGIFSSRYFFILLGPILLSLTPKLLALPFLLLEDLSRLGRFLHGRFRQKACMADNGKDPWDKGEGGSGGGSWHAAYPPRRKFISQAILGISALPFSYVLYGITKGAYNYTVYKSTLYFDDLPDAFDGFRITQLSDIHCGSFREGDAVKRGIELANLQGSDIVVLTGDIVNHEASEVSQWKDVLSELNAPFGVYSIFGNHDYGDYKDWASEEEKLANVEALKSLQAEMGFRLLLNEHVRLEKDGQFINLAGVENWGHRFRRYGDLKKTMEGVEENSFSVLLSHDPSHWEGEVLGFAKPIQLTLSGHTHGLQFGVDIPGLRWSPAKYMYRQWAGIYQEGPRYINVNRGFGFLGFQGRVGMWPEISVITLKKKPA